MTLAWEEEEEDMCLPTHMPGLGGGGGGGHLPCLACEMGRRGCAKLSEESSPPCLSLLSTKACLPCLPPSPLWGGPLPHTSLICGLPSLQHYGGPGKHLSETENNENPPPPCAPNETVSKREVGR